MLPCSSFLLRTFEREDHGFSSYERRIRSSVDGNYYNHILTSSTVPELRELLKYQEGALRFLNSMGEYSKKLPNLRECKDDECVEKAVRVYAEDLYDMNVKLSWKLNQASHFCPSQRCKDRAQEWYRLYR